MATRRMVLRFLCVCAGAALFSLAGCGSAQDAADDLAETGVAAWAEGRWRCETVERYSFGDQEPFETVVAISGNGRYTIERVGHSNPLIGTWSIEGLRLALTVPWDDDGSNGFYEWTHDADRDPPTRLESREVGSGEALDVEVDIDVEERRIRLTRLDDGKDPDFPYSWEATCTRESSDPGTIPPTVPPATRSD